MENEQLLNSAHSRVRRAAATPKAAVGVLWRADSICY